MKMRSASNDELRTFKVRVHVVYETVRAVRARTIRGALQAAHAGAEADYPGASIVTHGYEEQRHGA